LSTSLPEEQAISLEDFEGSFGKYEPTSYGLLRIKGIDGLEREPSVPKPAVLTPGDPFLNIYPIDPDLPVEVWFYIPLYTLEDEDDLRVEEIGCDCLGETPEWLDQELSNDGWNGIFGFDSWQRVSSAWSYLTEWALGEGIAPDQPFCIRLYPPRYVRCGGYDCEEWDVEWDWEVVKVAPWSQKRAADAWLKLLTLKPQMFVNQFPPYPEAPVHLWLQLDWDSSELGIFEVEEIKGPQIGERPEWLNPEDVDWGDVLGFNHPHKSYNRYGMDESDALWALHHGIAPRQPFCILLWPPFVDEELYGSDNEEAELSWKWELLEVSRISKHNTLKEWANFLRECREDAEVYHTKIERGWVFHELLEEAPCLPFNELLAQGITDEELILPIVSGSGV
jgi:hypothetical protein